MKIGILGTRGVPNFYGGFEQFAAYLSQYLKEKGHEVIVYSSSLHPYQLNEWNGVKLVHCKDLEDKIGTAGQFVYDYNCIRDARKRKFDILLQLGYTSSSVWAFLLPKQPIIVTNMDGLEWKRTKFSKPIQQFLKMAERWAVKSSDHLVADSIGIHAFLNKKYKVESTYIAYGAEVFDNANHLPLEQYGVKPNEYAMLIARMEPENNIETILDGMSDATFKHPFLVIGKTENDYSKYLIETYKKDERIRFLGGIYDLELLNNLRYHSKYYFHGHSVGGTNPSLLEAMASSAFIVAHDNVFNRSVLEKHALYFSSSSEITTILDESADQETVQKYKQCNLSKIRTQFSWNSILQAYEDLFIKLADRTT